MRKKEKNSIRSTSESRACCTVKIRLGLNVLPYHYVYGDSKQIPYGILFVPLAQTCAMMNVDVMAVCGKQGVPNLDLWRLMRYVEDGRLSNARGWDGYVSVSCRPRHLFE